MSETNELDLKKEFFEAIKADDIFGLTTMLNEHPELANAFNENNVSALMIASYYGRKEVIQLLLRCGAKMDVFTAAATGDLKRLEQALAEDNTVVSQYAVDGWSPLHLASFFGNTEAVRMILDAGASVHIRSTNTMNNHPLHAAAAGMRRGVVALLLERGADVNAKQAGGWTALHAAAQSGDFEMTKVLLANGADASIRADNGQSAMDLALGKGAQPIVDLLREVPGIQ